MRIRWIAALVAVLVLVPAAGASADSVSLRQVRAADLGVVRRDDRHGSPACRPTSSTPTARPASRRRRRTSAPTCGAPSPRTAAGLHRLRRARRAAVADADDARAHGALRRHRPVLQLVRPPRRARSSRTGRRARATSSTRSCRRSTTAGWPSACGSCSAASRRSPTARGALYDAMNFGFYYRPDVNRVLFHYRPDDPAASPCCYDTVVSESRIVDYIGIARGQLPQKEYYGRWRTFPDTCDWTLAGDQADRRDPHLLRRAGVRGRLPVQRHAGRRRPGAAACSRR